MQYILQYSLSLYCRIYYNIFGNIIFSHLYYYVILLLIMIDCTTLDRLSFHLYKGTFVTLYWHTKIPSLFSHSFFSNMVSKLLTLVARSSHRTTLLWESLRSGFTSPSHHHLHMHSGCTYWGVLDLSHIAHLSPPKFDISSREVTPPIAN